MLKEIHIIALMLHLTNLNLIDLVKSRIPKLNILILTCRYYYYVILESFAYFETVDHFGVGSLLGDYVFSVCYQAYITYVVTADDVIFYSSVVVKTDKADTGNAGTGILSVAAFFVYINVVFP